MNHKDLIEKVLPYLVTITGSISTTVTLKAKDEEEAIAKAHADFQKNLGDAHDYVDWLEETAEEITA